MQINESILDVLMERCEIVSSSPESPYCHNRPQKIAITHELRQSSPKDSSHPQRTASYHTQRTAIVTKGQQSSPKDSNHP